MLSRRGLRWALEGIVVGHLSVARVAEGLGVACNTAHAAAVLAEGKRVLIDAPGRSAACRSSGSMSADGGIPAAATSRSP